MISVIVPAYNAEKTLGASLESLLNQTYKELNIIIVDDASSDKTREIGAQYASQFSNIHIYSKANEGISAARNFGLSMVETEYFGFLDSDDIAEPTMFEKLYQSAKENDSDLVVCGFWWQYPNRSLEKIEGPYQSGKEMLNSCVATLWNKLYRTDFIKKLPLKFPFGYRYEDAYFLYCLTPYKPKLSFVLEPFVHYMQREGSITHLNNEKVKDMIHVFNAILEFYQQNGFYDAYKVDLEYLFTRFFLGNSFLRALQIEDKKLRNEVSDLSYNFLNEVFPQWRRNELLKKGGLKNLYFRSINGFTLPFYKVVLRIYANHKQSQLYK